MIKDLIRQVAMFTLTETMTYWNRIEKKEKQNDFSGIC